MRTETPNPTDTNEIVIEFNFETGNDLFVFWNLCDVLLFADIFLRFVKKSNNTHKLNPIYFVSLPGYKYQGTMKISNTETEILKPQEVFLSVQNGTGRDFSGVCGPRHIKSNGKWVILHVDENIS